jgi:hypothetical protein
MIARALEYPERHPGKTFAAMAVMLAAAYFAGTTALRKADGRLIVGDAVHYYVYVRSAVFDRDLQFRNEYVRLYRLRGGEADTGWIYEATPTGHVRNVMPVGPAIVWTPLYVTAAAIACAAHAAGVSIAVDGYGLLFQASAAISGIVAAALGAWLTYRLAARFFGARAAVWATLTVWIGSSALYYSLVSPAYSHSASMLAAGAFFNVWGTTIGDTRLARYARVGFFAGLAALVRWQDAVFLVAPLVEAVTNATQGWRRDAATVAPLGSIALQIGVALACAAVAFLPQNLVWLVLYGTPFTVPQGAEFMKWTQPALVRVLLSDWHGLFSWTPVAAVGVCGLVMTVRPPHALRTDARAARILAAGALAVFVISWYVNAAVADWWAGEAFGARRFVSCFPVFVLGIAAIGDRLARRPVAALALAAAICLSNGLLIVQYQLFMHGRRAPYPAGVYGMTIERFVVPVQIALERWHR